LQSFSSYYSIVTCVVGLEDDDRVWLGADSLGVAGYAKTIRRDPKIFRRGPYLIAFAGSYRVGQLLRWKIDRTGPEPGTDLAEFMATNFIDDVHLVLRKGGVTLRSGQLDGVSFMVGLYGRLFVVDCDFQIGEPVCGYDAIGSGADIAIGAIHVLPNLEPQVRVRRALEAAAAHNAGVQAPFLIKSATWK